MTEQENISELLSAHLDGEVTPDQRRRIEQAVKEDPGLAIELHELSQTRRLVADLPAAHAPRGFVRRVMARAERKHLLGAGQAGGAFRATRWITLAVAAVVLLAAGVGIFMITSLETDLRHADELAREPEHTDAPHARDDSRIGLGAPKGFVETVDKDAKGALAKLGKGGWRYGRPELVNADLGDALANASNAVIWTDSVDKTVIEVQRSLDRNDVLPLVLNDELARANEAKGQRFSRGGGNLYFNTNVDARQIQIVAYAPSKLIGKLQQELTDLGRRQRVSQAAGPEAPIVIARAGPGDLYESKYHKKGARARKPVPAPAVPAAPSKAPTPAKGGAPPVGKGPVVRATKPAPARPSKETGPGGADEDLDEPKKRDDGTTAVAERGAIQEKRTDNGRKSGEGLIAREGAGGERDRHRPGAVQGGAGTELRLEGADKVKTGLDSELADTAQAGRRTAAEQVRAPARDKRADLKNGGLSPVRPETVAAKPAVGAEEKAEAETRPAVARSLARAGVDVVAGTLTTTAPRTLPADVVARLAELQARLQPGTMPASQSARQWALMQKQLVDLYRQKIVAEEVRRNLKSQRDRGMDIQALIITVNYRGLPHAGKPAAKINAAARQAEDKARE